MWYLSAGDDDSIDLEASRIGCCCDSVSLPTAHRQALLAYSFEDRRIARQGYCCSAVGPLQGYSHSVLGSMSEGLGETEAGLVVWETDVCLCACVKLRRRPAVSLENLLELTSLRPLCLMIFDKMKIEGSKASSTPTIPTMASVDKDMFGSASLCWRWLNVCLQGMWIIKVRSSSLYPRKNMLPYILLPLSA